MLEKRLSAVIKGRSMKHLKINRALAVIFAVTLLFYGAPFVNASAQGSVAIEPESGTIGTQVSVYGEGFEKNTVYDIYFSSQDAAVGTARHIGVDITRYKKVLSASTTSFPGFNAAFNVPQTLDTANGGEYEISHDGDYYIYVTGSEDTLILAKSIFKMTGFAQVSLDPASGNVGDGVIITGTGYVPGETVGVAYDNKDVTSSHIGGNNTVNGSGAFTLTLTVPASFYGVHQIRITGSRTEGVVKQYSVIPEIKLNKTSVFAGDQISVTGSGFAGARGVNFFVGGEPVSAEWVLQDSGRTDEDGRFVVNMVIPGQPAGEYEVVAIDATSAQITAERSFTILPPPLNPQLSLDLVAGKVGETLTVSGEDFNRLSPVTLTIDGIAVELDAPINTDAGGYFSSSFEIPALPAGSHIIKASDGIEEAAASFSVIHVLSMSPLNGRAGTVVEVSGSGLEADAPVALYFDGKPLATTPVGARSGEDGSLDFGFIIPPCPPGDHIIELRTGSVNLVKTFSTAAEVSLGTDTVAVGRQLMVYTRGFAPNSPLLISLNGIQAQAVPTDASGSLDIAYLVPHVADGTYALTIEVAGVVITKSITIVAQAGISPAEGPVGTPVSISGSGFWPGKTLAVKWDGEALPGFVAPVADSNGSFSAVFNVPVAVPGEYIVSVSDGVISKQMQYKVEQTVPPAPLPVEPEAQTKISGHPHFEWGAVSYEYMNVTYEFQIIRNLAEPELVIGKPGLDETSCMLDKNEKLDKAGPDNPYYWRVRSVDEAGNTSPWSETREFYYGFIWPFWLTWVLVGLGVMIVIVVVYIFRWRIVDLFY
jgi:hypothetical protein